MSRPNILHILTDQQRFDTIRAGGAAHMRTPALDRLCAEGVRFDRAYTPSPVCVPARASLIYGQYPCSTGCYENHDMPTDGRQSLMDSLGAAGYHTMGIGKCHFMPDPHASRGFAERLRQEEYIRDPEKDEYYAYIREAGIELDFPHGLRGPWYYHAQPRLMPARHHPTQWVGDRCVDYLESRQDKDDPFYLYAGFIAPHPPLTPPQGWDELYPPTNVPLPQRMDPGQDHQLWINHFQNRYKCRDRGEDGFFLACMRSAYYASISFVDYQIGRLLDALERTGRLEDTLIVFHSDHGEYLGDYGCFGKRSMHDVSARVPLICRFPQARAAGRTVSTPVSLVDLAPTMIAAGGADINSHALEGVDLAEVVDGKANRTEVFSQYDHGGNAIYMAVDQRFKYVYSAADRATLFFDHANDPQERNNQAGSMQYREAEERLRRACIDFLRAGGETAAYDGDDWRDHGGEVKLGPEWKWWNMDYNRLDRNPNSNLLINPDNPDLPAGYLNPS